MLINKPAEIHSVKLSNSEAPSIAEILLDKNPDCSKISQRPEDAGLINRLDFETSGILIAAKKKKTWNKLRQMIQDGKIKKGYIALLEGRLPESISIDNFIGSPNRGASKVRVYKKRPYSTSRVLQAQSILAPLEYLKEIDCTIAEISAPTARRHQVRAHSASIGHPLVGDKLYGSNRELSQLLKREGLPPFFLHALWLELQHPETGELLTKRCPPPEWASFLNKDLSVY